MNTKTSPKDFFFHLSATVVLYVSVISLLNLAFEITNRMMSDALQVFYGVGQLIWPISMLIVLVPILYVIEWLIEKDVKRMPEKRELSIRKWRIYLTLFLTGAAIAGDIIVLINTYLNGEISSRFISKILIVLFVSALIFAYYLLVKGINSEKSLIWKKILSITGIVVVLICIVSAFIIVGSPAKQRALRLDQQRINDLSSIQYQIVDYWQKVGKLPASLEAINDKLSNYVAPVDPETGKAYEYNVKETQIFDLCASFDLKSGDSNLNNGRNYPVSILGKNDNWTHSIGRACFERTIDSTMYPVLQPVQLLK